MLMYITTLSVYIPAKLMAYKVSTKRLLYLENKFHKTHLLCNEKVDFMRHFLNRLRFHLRKLILLSTPKDMAPKGVVPKKYIGKFIPNDPVIIEAGAHVGSDTIEMAKLWPKGHIYAFECIPHLFEKLYETTKKYKNVKCCQMAIGEQNGSAEIFVSSGSSDGSSSLMPPHEHLTEHPDVHFAQKMLVQTTTIDQWASENNIKNVDLLWLDMQGYELVALKSSPHILSTVRAVYSEVNLKELYKGAPLYPEFRQWMKSHGFEVVREELAWEDAGNVLFVNTRKS